MFGLMWKSSGTRGVTRAAVEFCIIVAGVLAALSAEEWRQSRAEAVLEAEYLQRLAADVRTDLDSSALRAGRLEQKNAALTRVIDWLENPDRTEEALRRLVVDLPRGSYLAYGAGTDAQQTTFDELVNTGRLQLIRDIEIRSALTSYYAQIQTQRTRVLARETAYAPRIYELVPNESEFVPRKDLALADLLIIAEKVEIGGVEELATAELNRGKLRIEVNENLSARATSVLELLESQLALSE